MKRKWAERKAKEQEAKRRSEELVKQAAKAEYERRESEGELTEDEEYTEFRRKRKNEMQRQKRAKWDDFCSTLHQNLLLEEIGALYRKEAPPVKPTLKTILRIAEYSYGFTITDEKLARLKRILDR
jgi:hypothetical protein